MVSGEDLAEAAGPLLIRLDDAEGRARLASWARSFECEPDAVWWWASAMGRARVVDHDPESWGDLFAAELRQLGGDRVHLVLTDDDAPPWPVFELPKAAVTGLLAELPYFEFFLVSGDERSILFDTHHDQLVRLER